MVLRHVTSPILSAIVAFRTNAQDAYVTNGSKVWAVHTAKSNRSPKPISRNRSFLQLEVGYSRHGVFALHNISNLVGAQNPAT